VQGSSKGSRSQLHGNVASQQELSYISTQPPRATMPSDYLPQPLYQHEATELFIFRLRHLQRTTLYVGNSLVILSPLSGDEQRVAASTPVRAMSLGGAQAHLLSTDYQRREYRSRQPGSIWYAVSPHSTFPGIISHLVALQFPSSYCLFELDCNANKIADNDRSTKSTTSKVKIPYQVPKRMW